MSVTVGVEDLEEILIWAVSDETLEIAAGQAIAGAYTLQYCTSVDCGIIERDGA